MKTQIVKVCKAQGTYKKEVDDFQIDNLIFNLILIANAKEDILKRGQMIDIGNSRTFMQLNYSISVFHNAVKSINTVLKQLGLEKAKVETDPKEDAMKALNELLKS